MATVEALAIRREAAQKQLVKHVNRLSKQFNLVVPDFPTFHHDPEFLRAQQIEWMADAFGQLVEQTGGDGESSETTDNAKPATKARGKSAAKAKDA